MQRSCEELLAGGKGLPATLIRLVRQLQQDKGRLILREDSRKTLPIVAAPFIMVG
jgi:hypothetical protein